MYPVIDSCTVLLVLFHSKVLRNVFFCSSQELYCTSVIGMFLGGLNPPYLFILPQICPLTV